MTTPELPYYPITHDDGLNIVEALNDLIGTENSLSLIAEDFDETKSYDVGNYVRYSTLLYRFTTPHPAGVWNENHVTPIKVGEQLNVFNNEKINNNAVAPEFRNDANYAIGDVVSYQGGLYRYISPHIAGDWNRIEVVTTNAISESGSGGGNSSGGVGDTITFDGHNMIVTSSERSIESLESSIAIVVNGNTHPLINSGKYIYVKMHDTLPEGLYKTLTDIAENAELNNLNVTSASGVLNNKADSSSAISNISRDGITYTATRADGTSFTFTQAVQGIQNNLTSTATDQALSANMGRLLANGSARDSTKITMEGQIVGPNGTNTFNNVNGNFIFIINRYDSTHYSYTNMTCVNFIGTWQIECYGTTSVVISKSGSTVTFKSNSGLYLYALILKF